MKRAMLILLAALLLAGCGNKPATPLPLEAQENYLAMCEQGGSADECECSLRWVEKHVTQAQVAAAEVRIRNNDQYPSWMYDAAAACGDE